jgi:cell division septal protein FtsQ
MRIKRELQQLNKEGNKFFQFDNKLEDALTLQNFNNSDANQPAATAYAK